MAFDIALWERKEYSGTAVYVRGDLPAWFVPNRKGDEVLRRVAEGELSAEQDIQARRFLNRLPDAPPHAYSGRSDALEVSQLHETWFHLTNRCNMACRHCLFSSSPADARELPAPRLLEHARAASALGCRVFALTGGEPFMHRDIPTVVDGLLEVPDSHVAILTNGMLLPEHASSLERWDPERLHLQISVDGLKQSHDRIRGAGSFDTLTKVIDRLTAEGWPFTLSMCVQASTVEAMPKVVDYAAEHGAANVHFMWYFIRGRATREEFALPERIVPWFQEAVLRAQYHGIGVDNVDALKNQVFAPPGTRHDGTNAGWEAVTVGPDDKLYPTPALVGIDELATPLDGGLEQAWKRSPVLEDLRTMTAARLDDAFRFILGGGDPDHAYAHSGTFAGTDPYTDMQRNMALWLITREAARQPESRGPGLRLKMGDVLEQCGTHGSVALVHSNCLLALAHEDTRSTVKAFYTDAAQSNKTDILNPVCYPEEHIRHIPKAFRFRGYGCGSPVLDARLTPGEQVVDLGCGTGTECFVAAKLVGPIGSVTGMDMLDPMLERARAGATAVAASLGYANVKIEKGYLESLPLEDSSADVMLSNCVINLSSAKRDVFAEILRVLRPGGRLVVSDVVCEDEPDPSVRNDEVLRGECIAGALTQKDLYGMLEDMGFIGLRVLKRFPYRTVHGHPFFSLTFQALKPQTEQTHRVMYTGPLEAVIAEDGTLLTPGVPQTITTTQDLRSENDLLVIDDQGNITNVDQGESCCCAIAPEDQTDGPTTLPAPGKASANAARRYAAGCMVCGQPLHYLDKDQDMACAICEQSHRANALCSQGHYVCDACHAAEGIHAIAKLCAASRETDMIALLQQLRERAALPAHGPDHHSLVPAIILTAYRNLGGDVTDDDILQAIRRGQATPGGSCGFLGICGAAVGVGIAFSIILKANPLTPRGRSLVQKATARVLANIAALEAARCCQRECAIALKTAAELSEHMLPTSLQPDTEIICTQQTANDGCLGRECPLHPARSTAHSRVTSD